MSLGYRKSMAIAILGAATAVLAPSVGLAFSSGFDEQPVSIQSRGGIGSFTPASVDPDLVSNLKFKALRGDKMFRFTPANASGEGKRAMTIAVRVRSDAAQAVNIKPQIAGSVGRSTGAVQITQSAYSLGVAKGFQKFALPVSQRSESLIPDLSELGQSVNSEESTGGKKSRFSPRVEIDSQKAASATTRAFDDQGSYSLDVGGSYKLSRNLDVTAGIRLKSDRERLGSLTNDQFDSQAVFVGTEFRF